MSTASPIRVMYESGVAVAEHDMAQVRGPSNERDIVPWRGGLASTEDRDNFVTNKVTTVETIGASMKSRRTALGLSATWACVNLLAGTIASLPLMIYRTSRDGVREVARDHPLYRVLHDSPNADQTAVDFWEYQCAGIELQGNAYATIERRGDGSVIALTPVKPDLVRARRQASGAIEYVWFVDGRETVKRDPDVFHIRGPLGGPLSGASTLSACAGVFASAMSADDAASTLFGNGVRPSGVLSTAAGDSLSAQQRSELEALLQERFVGALNAGRPMLLDRGMQWQQLAMSPEDAQMLESRGYGVEEICRIFGVPPHMVGHPGTASNFGTGIEQQTLGFVKFSLRRRLKRIEQAIEKQLLTTRDRAQGMTVEFNLEGLLRGDSAGRSGFYERMVRLGVMTRNEVRRLENLPPIAGGDEVMVQMQDVPLVRVLRGEEI